MPGDSREEAEAEPLRPLVFAILLALNEQDRHGYAIMQMANRQLRRRALLWRRIPRARIPRRSRKQSFSWTSPGKLLKK